MKKKALQILEWCILNYGTSIYYSQLPKLIIKKLDKSDFFGVFDEEKVLIEIHDCNIKNTNSLIKTIIHEYVHYMQPPGIYEIIEFYNSGSYNKNPLEQWAVKIENRDWRKCKKDLNLK
jgi:hypothetical protein